MLDPDPDEMSADPQLCFLSMKYDVNEVFVGALVLGQ
jgi:hypothetical protein